MSDSREQFEAWCKSRNQDTTRDDRPDPALAWGYMNMITHELWVGWDAAWNRRAQPERKLTDAEIRELAHKHLNGTGDHCIINFARSLLAAQPAAATVPDGWKLVPDWKVGMRAMFHGYEYEIFAIGDKQGTFDLRLPSGIGDRWVNVPPDMLQPPAAQPAQDDGENMHAQSTHQENVSKNFPAIDMSCSESRRRAGLVYSRTCPICKLGPCMSKAKP